MLQKNSYFPFGGLQKALSSNLVSGDNQNRYLFNGKESEPEFGLAAYDFDARFYDKQTGRWFNPDPLEQYDSPYVFGGNNPVLNIDPSGMWAFPYNGTHNYTVVDGQGKIIDHVDDGDNSIYQVGIDGYNGSKEGLFKIGRENEDREYRVGDYLDGYSDLNGNYKSFTPRASGDAYSSVDLDIVLLFSGAKAAQMFYKYILKSAIREGLISIFKSKKVGHTKKWSKMNKKERRAFKHSYSRHKDELGLPNFKESNAEHYRRLFNAAVYTIRKAGRRFFFKSKELVNGKKVTVRRTEVTINGEKFYYYETLNGKFVSAGKIPN